MGYLCTCARAEIPPTPRFCISETPWPIVFKFGMWVGGHYLSAFHKSLVECICTCARSHPLFYKCSACRYSVMVGPIALKFGMHLGPISYSLCSSHGCGISARAHVHTALLYIRNGWADWVQFWCVSWGSWTRCLTQVVGGVSLHVRTCRPHFCISGSAWPIGFNFGVWVGGHELGA